jgi:hypothetical protein
MNEENNIEEKGQGVQQPTITSSAYFTRDIEDKVNGMSEVEMFQELTNVESTRAWIAILKYNQFRLKNCQAALFSADPFKDPTSITRNQGIMIGLSDLQNAIILLKQEKDEAIKKEEAPNG